MGATWAVAICHYIRHCCKYPNKTDRVEVRFREVPDIKHSECYSQAAVASRRELNIEPTPDIAEHPPATR